MVDDHTVRVDFLKKDRLTIPDLAVIVPCVINSELVKKHATEKDPWGLEYTKQNTAGSGAYKVASWTAGTEVILERNDEWKSAGRCRRSSASSGAWCRRPATGARCWSAATPTSPTSCRTRISSSCKRRRQAQHRVDAVLERHPVSRHEREEPAVRQSEGAPGGRLRDPLPEDHGRGAVRARQADVRRGGRQADRGRLAAAAQVQHRHREGQAADGRSRLSERLRDHAVVRPRLCHRQRADGGADPGEPRPDRHQGDDQQDPGRELPHRAEQEGAAALHQRVLGLARLSRVLLHLVLSRQEFDLQHHELPVEGHGRLHRRRRERRRHRRQGDLREGREGLRRSRLRRHPAHPALPALLQRGDAEERVRLPVLVPPPPRLPRAW